MIKHVLVTGGAGYVGAILVPKLLKAGYFVKVIDWFIFRQNVFAHLKNNQQLKQIKGDIRNAQLLKKELPGIDAVIHLASISNDPTFELNPVLGKSVNYDATCRLLDLAQQLGVQRFIYASSASVYGIKKELEVTEDLPLEPLTDYSKYKALSEQYLLKNKYKNFTVVILRPATVCGYSPRMRLDLTLNLLTVQALLNRKITLFGGNQRRPHIHIQDMTDLYLKCLKYPSTKISGKIFNVGNNNYTLKELAKIIRKSLSDNKIKIMILPIYDNRSYKISSNKIWSELAFRPAHTLEEAILDLKRAVISGKIPPQALSYDSYFNINVMKKPKIS